MPELPEVESLRRSLRGIVGRRIESISVSRWDVVVPTSRERRATKQPSTSRNPAALLEHARITELVRRGKHLAIVADNQRVIDVHLGMSGQLLHIPRGKSPPRNDHIHIAWTFDDQSTLLFRDPRRFGGVWPATSMDELQRTRWASLGPDALAITDRQLAHLLEGTRRNIKTVLMDQTAIAGLGNIYVVEALFAAGIRPTRPASRVRAEEAAHLAEAVRQILAAAIKAGGSTLRDYLDGTGQEGSYQRGHRVYGREDQPCMTCGSKLRHSVMQQRATVWCATCQR